MTDRDPGVPLLAGAQIPLAERDASRWVERVLSLAGEVSATSRSLRTAARSSSLDALGLLEAAISSDEQRLTGMAERLEVDSDALMAVAAVAAMPLLQALRHRFAAATDPGWDEGYCPVCGGWPLLADCGRSGATA